MSKPVDKRTKAELIQVIHALSTRATAAELALAQRDADVLRLKADLEALNTRRQFEAQTYRSQIREARARSRGASARTDWATAAKEYCEQHGCKTVSQDQLRAHLAARAR